MLFLIASSTKVKFRDTQDKVVKSTKRQESKNIFLNSMRWVTIRSDPKTTLGKQLKANYATHVYLQIGTTTSDIKGEYIWEYLSINMSIIPKCLKYSCHFVYITVPVSFVYNWHRCGQFALKCLSAIWVFGLISVLPKWKSTRVICIQLAYMRAICIELF